MVCPWRGIDIAVKETGVGTTLHGSDPCYCILFKTVDEPFGSFEKAFTSGLDRRHPHEDQKSVRFLGEPRLP